MEKRTAEERAEERYLYLDGNGEGHRIFNERVSLRRDGFAACIREEVEPLEAENAKLLALVQGLVDDMRKLRIEFGNRTGTTTQIGIASLGKSEQHGFVPTNTKEDNG